MVLYVLGKVVMVEGGLLLLPLVTALIYREAVALSIGISIIIALALGFLLTKISKPGLKTIYAKEGFVITALSWLALSAVGALPFFISGEIPSYVDAFFETVSGLTTTGASILTDVESMSKGLLMWRSFTHWVGGMGVLVFVMAIIPSISDRSIHLLRAEVPGPVVGKIVPKIRETTRILYIIYIALTLTEVVFLLLGGMDLFEFLAEILLHVQLLQGFFQRKLRRSAGVDVQLHGAHLHLRSAPKKARMFSQPAAAGISQPEESTKFG